MLNKYVSTLIQIIKNTKKKIKKSKNESPFEAYISYNTVFLNFSYSVNKEFYSTHDNGKEDVCLLTKSEIIQKIAKQSLLTSYTTCHRH